MINNPLLAKPNPGKKLAITIDGTTYLRYPIKTHLITANDNLSDIINKYADKILQKNDLLVLSERIVAITQNRSFLIKDIKPGWWAKKLSQFVSCHPGGIGLKSPWTMELAIKEAGLPRILLASAVALITKPFGIKGWFYKAAGNNINAIDGPCGYTLPPGNQSAKLGPKEPMKTAQKLSLEFKVKVSIIDANDYGVCVMGYSSGVDKKLTAKIFSDNPLGQTKEQTPLAVVRKV